MSAFRGLDISASGMTANRIWQEVVAVNIANAETTEPLRANPFAENWS